MTPDNRQNHLPVFEKKIGEGIHFFLCRDFLLLYSWGKLYAPDIWADLCRSRIIIALQILHKSLFLFYGKRFLFYWGDAMRCVSMYIFRHKGHTGYIDLDFKMQEWDSRIAKKGIQNTGLAVCLHGTRYPEHRNGCLPLWNRESGASGWLPVVASRVSGAPDWLPVAASRVSGAPDWLPVAASRISGASDWLPVIASRISGASDWLPVIASRVSGAPDWLPVVASRVSGASDWLPVTASRISGASDWAPCFYFGTNYNLLRYNFLPSLSSLFCLYYY